MKIYNTLDELLKDFKNVNVQRIINGRMYCRETGWIEVEISSQLHREVVDWVLNILGGRSKTRKKLEHVLMFCTPQHWGLGRMCIEKADSLAFLSYTAGQDYGAEIGEIRNELKTQ